MFKQAIVLALFAGASAFAPANRAFVRPSTAVNAGSFEDVKKIIVEQLGVDAKEVVEEASFVDDLGADSLDTVELIMAIEEEFDCEIPEEEAETISTVGDAWKFVEKL
mmetsp:Transcript_19348/g.27351  ORF Transcript_19348/g.27351 Transcript_19348/m.27351 type:complete len:108 (-) Transcript_19348:122-445(-)